MNKSPANITCVACSVFRSELEALQARGDADVPVRYIDAMLHVYPSELRTRLEALVADERKQGKRVVLLYGDCHAYMDDDALAAGARRVRGMNCFEVVLGPEEYRRQRRDGAFLLLHEWALRWRELLDAGVGLDGEDAKSFMGELHTKLVYLDTGVVAVPQEHLEAMSDFFDLPWETMTVPLDHLLAAINDALAEVRRHGA